MLLDICSLLTWFLMCFFTIFLYILDECIFVCKKRFLAFRTFAKNATIHLLQKLLNFTWQHDSKKWCFEMCTLRKQNCASIFFFLISINVTVLKRGITFKLWTHTELSEHEEQRTISNFQFHGLVFCLKNLGNLI